MDLLNMPYTDDSILTTGKYKFTKLKKIPSEYFLNIFYRENKNGKYPDKKLISYIEDNMEKILERTGQEPPETELKVLDYRMQGKSLVIICKDTDKIIFLSEKDAKSEIQRINKRAQEHKKPTRSYECPKCGGWHITSKAHKDWVKNTE